MTERPPDATVPPGVRVLRRAGHLILLLPRVLAWAPPVLWGSAIFLLSSMEATGTSPKWWELGGLTLNLAHAFVFGVLALLVVPLLGRRAGPDGRWTALSPVGALWVFAAVVMYGFTDELHQSTVEGRDASLIDLATDAAGAASTLVVILYVGRDDATTAGLWRRLAIGLLACVACAAAATLHGGGPWPF